MTDKTEVHDRIGLFTGSFDPFTIGHADIVRRALQLVDKLYIVITVNPAKQSMFTTEERMASIKRLYEDEPRVVVKTNSGMTIDFAHKVGARLIIRGVRSTIDFEYEKVQAEFNQRLGGLETVLLFSSPELSSVSSSAYRQLVLFHQDASWMLPHKG